MKLNDYINAIKIPLLSLVALTIINLIMELSSIPFYTMFYSTEFVGTIITETGYLRLFLGIITTTSVGWFLARKGSFIEFVIGGIGFSVVAFVLRIISNIVYFSINNALLTQTPGFEGIILYQLFSGADLVFMPLTYFITIAVASNIIFVIIGGTVAQLLSNKISTQ